MQKMIACKNYSFLLKNRNYSNNNNISFSLYFFFTQFRIFLSQAHALHYKPSMPPGTVPSLLTMSTST